VRKAILEHWIPALITAILGGVLVAVLGPLLQSHFAEATATAERKVKLAESVSEHLSGFISAHFQLVELARHERALESQGRSIDEKERGRKEEYRIRRDDSHYRLRRDLIMVPFYFGENVQQAVREYTDFIRGVSTASVDQMPAREEFEIRANRVVSAMLKSLE